MDSLDAKKQRAFDDYYNGGEPRSLPDLAQYYQNKQAEGFEVPTTSLSLLQLWSNQNNWLTLANERRSSSQEKLEALLQSDQLELQQQRLQLAKSSLNLSQTILDKVAKKLPELDDFKISHLAQLLPTAVKLAEFGTKESRLEEQTNSEQYIQEAVEKVLETFPTHIQEKIRQQLKR